MADSCRARAALGLTLLSTLERDHPDLAVRVRAEIDESTRQEYDTVATLRWVSMQSHMDLSDRIRESIGMTNNADFWRRAFFEVLNRPLFAGFINAFKKLMGPKPEIIARVGPDIFRRLFDNAGTLTIRGVEDQYYFAEASFRGFPASEYALMCFVEGVTGAFLSAGHIVDMKLEVTRLSVDAKGHFVLAIGEARA